MQNKKIEIIKTNKFLQSFAINRSRSFSEKEDLEFESLLSKFKIPDNLKESKKVCLEIGSGNGDFIIHKAQTEKDKIFIASDVFKKGALQILKKADALKLTNFFFFFGDARVFLDGNKTSLNEIYVLFPDPWPKKRHNKRRIINSIFLELVNSNLNKNGTLHIATDHLTYQDWINDILGSQGLFDVECSDYTKTLNFNTKYFNKSLKNTSQSLYWKCKKKS